MGYILYEIKARENPHKTENSREKEIYKTFVLPYQGDIFFTGRIFA